MQKKVFVRNPCLIVLQEKAIFIEQQIWKFARMMYTPISWNVYRALVFSHEGTSVLCCASVSVLCQRVECLRWVFSCVPSWRYTCVHWVVLICSHHVSPITNNHLTILTVFSAFLFDCEWCGMRKTSFWCKTAKFLWCKLWAIVWNSGLEPVVQVSQIFN